jgi:hypothetical protein
MGKEVEIGFECGLVDRLVVVIDCYVRPDSTLV